MNNVELGKRIRALRLSKQMTQSELVGDFITRNMLSQIESGNAVPSMRTLTYLAEKLGIMPGELMDTAVGGLDILTEAKQAFGEGRFSEVLSIVERFSPALFDEGVALGAMAHFSLAEQCEKNGQRAAAMVHFQAVLDCTQMGVYTLCGLREQALVRIGGLSQG